MFDQLLNYNCITPIVVIDYINKILHPFVESTNFLFLIYVRINVIFYYLKDSRGKTVQKSKLNYNNFIFGYAWYHEFKRILI